MLGPIVDAGIGRRAVQIAGLATDSYPGCRLAHLVAARFEIEMTGRPGLFGGPRQGDASERDAFSGDARDSLLGGAPAFGGAPGFDPVWGTLGPPSASAGDPWGSGPQDPDEGGPTVDVDIFGDGFEIAGQIRAGQFPRLSDWLNMQQGFIPVQNASICLLYTSPSPRDRTRSRMPSSA